jgi:predicted DNA-binding transcriptional regulator AlpA
MKILPRDGGGGEPLRPLLTKRDVSRLLAESLRSFDRQRAAGVIPSPDVWVGNSPRWKESTIRDWLDGKPRLPGRGA